MPFCKRRIHRGTKSIRLDADVYARLASKKRDDETFSEAVDRLIDDWSLLDIADTDDRADRHRERLERARADAADREELLTDLGIDTE